MTIANTEEVVVAETEADDTPQEMRAFARRIADIAANAKPVHVEVVQREGRGHFSVSLKDE
jgi:hypothetical protein